METLGRMLVGSLGEIGLGQGGILTSPLEALVALKNFMRGQNPGPFDGLRCVADEGFHGVMRN